jgi:hypothetical protein
VARPGAAKELERQTLALVAATGSRLASTGAVRRLVHVVVQGAIDSPTFRATWVQANRTAHEQLIAVLEDRSNVALDDQGRVTIELGTVLTTIAQDLASRGLIDADQVPDVQASIPVMDADQLAELRRAYNLLQALGFWLPVFWAASVLLALLLARRRLAAASKLAIASLLMVGVFAVGLAFARDSVTEDLPDPEVAQAVWDVVVASLWRAIEVIAVVLAVVALVTGLLGRRWGRPVPPA